MLCGAFEENGRVILEDDTLPRVSLSWREAMERCKAVAEMEQREKYNNRNPRIQKIIEEIIEASVAARKKEDPSWSPPGSVLGYTLGISRPRIRVS